MRWCVDAVEYWNDVVFAFWKLEVNREWLPVNKNISYCVIELNGQEVSKEEA